MGLVNLFQGLQAFQTVPRFYREKQNILVLTPSVFDSKEKSCWAPVIERAAVCTLNDTNLILLERETNFVESVSTLIRMTNINTISVS